MTGFPPQCGMELASWKENLDGILTGVQNGGGQLEGKPRPDFCQIPERSWLVGQKNRTGCCPESGIELAGWREDPDQIFPGVQNGVDQLERKPRLDFRLEP